MADWWNDFAAAFGEANQQGYDRAFGPDGRPRMDRDMMLSALESAPGIGDAQSAGGALGAALRGDYGEAALGALSALPFLPAMGSIKEVGGAFRRGAPQATEKLAELSGIAPPGWKGVHARKAEDPFTSPPGRDDTLPPQRGTPLPHSLERWIAAEKAKLGMKR